MGVKDEFNPANFKDGQLLCNHLLQKEKKASEQNKALVDSILVFLRGIFTPNIFIKTPLKSQNKLPEILMSYFVGKELSPYIGLQYYDDWYYNMVLKSVEIILPNIFIQSRKNPLAQKSVVRASGFLVSKMFQFIKEEYKLEFRITEDILNDWNLKEFIPDYGLKKEHSYQFSNS
ncbi:MAG: hypothetical protein JWN78_2974, partial [Bacteroidota bacterium]|nr:hypothetical protein [Bacteroidota bacterium]